MVDVGLLSPATAHNTRDCHCAESYLTVIVAKARLSLSLSLSPVH